MVDYILEKEGSETLIGGLYPRFTSLAEVDDTRVIGAWMGDNAGDDGFVALFTRETDGSITKHASLEFITNESWGAGQFFKIDATHFLHVYSGFSGFIYAVIFTLNLGTNTITKGSSTSINLEDTPIFGLGSMNMDIVKMTDTRYMIVSRDDDFNDHGRAVMLDVNNSTFAMSVGAEYSYLSSSSKTGRVERIDDTHALVIYQKNTGNREMYAKVATYSGTVITYGTEVQISTKTAGFPCTTKIGNDYYVFVDTSTSASSIYKIQVDGSYVITHTNTQTDCLLNLDNYGFGYTSWYHQIKNLGGTDTDFLLSATRDESLNQTRHILLSFDGTDFTVVTNLFQSSVNNNNTLYPHRSTILVDNDTKALTMQSGDTTSNMSFQYYKLAEAGAETFFKTVDGDAVVIKKYSDDVTGDASLWKQSSYDVTSESFLLKQFSDDVTGDASLWKQSSYDVDSDSFIIKQFSDIITGDASLWKQSSYDVDGDAVVFKQFSDDVTANSYLFKQYSDDVTGDAYILKPTEGEIIANAYLFKQFSDNISGTSYLFKQLSDNISGTSYLFKQYSDNITADSYLWKQISDIVTGESFLVKVPSKDIDGNSYLFKRYSDTIGADAVLFKSIFDDVTGESYIFKRISDTINADAFLAELLLISPTIKLIEHFKAKGSSKIFIPAGSGSFFKPTLVVS